MEWVNVFKKEMHDLHTHIFTWAQDYRPESQRDQDAIERLLRDFGDFYQWANIFPDETDTEAWRWIGGNVVKTRGGSDEWLTQILLIKFYFASFKSRVKVAIDTDPYTPSVQTSFETIERLLNENLASKPSPSKETSEQILRPQTILTILWPYLYPAMVDQPFSAFDVHDWPPAHYHPYHTRKLIYDCVFILSRKQSALVALVPFRAPESVYVQPYRTADFFELKLSVQGSLMPARWDGLINRLSDQMEPLREIGGTIEPLTWDEGNGQGVIVKLPWGKPA